MRIGFDRICPARAMQVHDRLNAAPTRPFGETMRTIMIVAIATMLASTAGFSQSAAPANSPTTSSPEARSTKESRTVTPRTTVASTPEARSAAAGTLARADLRRGNGAANQGSRTELFGYRSTRRLARTSGRREIFHRHGGRERRSPAQAPHQLRRPCR
jgi:hypothetical protein